MSKKVLQSLVSQIDRAAKLRKGSEMEDSGSDAGYKIRDAGFGMFSRIANLISVLCSSFINSD